MTDKENEGIELVRRARLLYALSSATKTIAENYEGDVACGDSDPMHRLYDVIHGYGIIDENEMNSACKWTSKFLLPFAIELGLKGIIAMNDECFSLTHDLAKLFNEIPSEIRESMENEFRNCVGEAGKFKNDKLSDVLKRHKLDFADFRYPNKKQKDNTHPGELEYVIRVIIETEGVMLVRGSKWDLPTLPQPKS